MISDELIRAAVISITALFGVGTFLASVAVLVAKWWIRRAEEKFARIYALDNEVSALKIHQALHTAEIKELQSKLDTHMQQVAARLGDILNELSGVTRRREQS